MKENKNFLSSMFDDVLPLMSFRCENTKLKTDIIESDGKYIFNIEVPGIKKEDIEITMEDGYMIVALEKKKETEENTNYLRKEIRHTAIERSYYVGEVKIEEIQASLTDGILSIMVPNYTEDTNKTKTIKIN